ncbi:hypothetical protein SAMN05661096_03378 [Marivirga sericea]|uniref:Uncharacterized protein n=1 Tax=Marivirga sericea TaxID=1028 RepID=A0A1X7L2C6_9BACT|nr:hypothetical protein [Marivirga sericea]SMG47362.1 hypothetical protein SAMN05661096_03378 [Marivirga sericea]
MIKTASLYIGIFVASLAFLWACEPCDDCGPDNAYPYFNLSILNKTSLDTLTQYKARLNNEIEVVDAALADPENAPVVDSLNNLRNTKTDSLAIINGLITITNSGTISIESINGTTNLFENKNGGDSLSSFKIPLKTTESQSEYVFQIEFSDFQYSLKIEYELSDTIINSKITKSAKELNVIEHQFDSLAGPYGCNPVSKCISNELEIYVEI